MNSLGWEPPKSADYWRARALAAELNAARYEHMRANAEFQDRNGPGIYWYLPRWDRGLPIGERLDRAVDSSILEQMGSEVSVDTLRSLLYEAEGFVVDAQTFNGITSDTPNKLIERIAAALAANGDR